MVAAISSVYQSDTPTEATAAFVQLFNKR